MVRLIMPTIQHKTEIREFIDEGRRYNVSFNGTSRVEELTFNEWLNKVTRHHLGVDLDPGYVPASTFLVYHDEKLVGFVNIRHTLNAYLKEIGGHIGYMIRPTEQRKGYGKALLKEALKYTFDDLKLTEVFVSCDASNIASKRTILANNGVLYHVTKENDEDVFMYVIQRTCYDD